MSTLYTRRLVLAVWAVRGRKGTASAGSTSVRPSSRLAQRSQTGSDLSIFIIKLSLSHQF